MRDDYVLKWKETAENVTNIAIKRTNNRKSLPT